ncbi:MAG: DNA translocase FtsK [Dysgonamonadaceae bacterium]|nr:DNA translocase FtsK [Dysgonamonadaceae bacterium]
MAKRKPAEKQTKGAAQSSKIKDFITSNTTRYIAGLFIFSFAFFAFLSMVSFFFTGNSDQSKIENISFFHWGRVDNIQNWAGLRGAILGDILVNRWFGVSTVFLVYFVAIVGLKMMKTKYFNLLKIFIICSILTIWSSSALAFFFGKLFGDTAFYIGGKHGRILSGLSVANFGIFGTFLILLVFFVIIMAALSRKTIPFLTGLFSKKQKENGESEENESSRKKTWWKRKTENEEKDENDEDFVPQNDKPNILVVDSDSKKDPFSIQEDIDMDISIPEDEIYIPDSESKKRDNLEIEKDDSLVPPPSSEDDDLLEELGVYDPTLDLSQYEHPPIDLLKKYNYSSDNQIDMKEQNNNKDQIIKTLEHYNIKIKSIKATVGPTITLYEIVPEDGVRISKIRNLEDDIAMSLKALGIRIIAPMPGKGTVGIEIPNKDPQIVSMHSIIASRKYQESTFDLPIALGKTITNEVFMVDLTKMPHLLVAGATGQGKSVGLNAAITSMLYKKHPAELKFVLVDPKMVEFNIYSVIEKHFLAKLPDEANPIITDFTKVVHTLNSLTKEMDDRYMLLNQASTRNVKEYNDKFINRRLNPRKGHHFMPYIVVIIDEFGDLIMTAGKEIELPIARIAQKARAVGIHMIIATQRPTTNIITGTIKANFPARVAFRVMAMIDSRTILDNPGANQLIGRGDLLFTQGSDMTRVQCAFVDTPEVEKIARFIGSQRGYPTAFMLPEFTGESGGNNSSDGDDLSNLDDMFEEAARMIVIHQQGSTSLIQRKLSLGYNRAGRIMDQMEHAGIVGPSQGSKPRDVYVQDEYSLEQILKKLKQ